MGVYSFSLLISAQRLYTEMSDVQIIDARDRKQYEAGHIPGALHMPPQLFEGEVFIGQDICLTGQLRDIDYCVEQLQVSGIDDSRPIVIYDQGGSFLAARLWWVLQIIGHERVAILNGGYTAWTAEMTAVDFHDPPRYISEYQARPRMQYLAEFADVLTATASSTILCDLLPARQYQLGSIPGSINLPYTSLFVGKPVPTIRRAFEAEAVFSAAGIQKDSRVIFFCGDGYCGALGFFCARLLEMQNVSLYDGSLAEWRARGGTSG